MVLFDSLIFWVNTNWLIVSPLQSVHTHTGCSWTQVMPVTILCNHHYLLLLLLCLPHREEPVYVPLPLTSAKKSGGVMEGGVLYTGKTVWQEMIGVCLFVHSHLSLRSSPPGIGEDGADNTLRSGVAWCRHFWYAAVWLAGVIGLGLWIMVTQTNKHKEALLSFSIMVLRVHSMTTKLCEKQKGRTWKAGRTGSWLHGGRREGGPIICGLRPPHCLLKIDVQLLPILRNRRASSDKQQQEN